MTQFQILTHDRTTQIEVTIFHAKVITSIALILNSEWRNFRSIKDIELADEYLYITSRDTLVFGITLSYYALCLNAVFTTELASHLAKFFRCVLVECQLGNTISVTKINEGKSAKIVDALYPSGESDLLAYIFNAEFTAGICSVHIILL